MKARVTWIVVTVLVVAGLLIGSFGCAAPTTTPSAPQAPKAPEAPKPGATTAPTTAAPKPEKVIRLKFADWDPAVSVFVRAYREPWAKLIERETGGRVVIDVYGSETLVKAADLNQALLDGVADIVLESPQFMPGQKPLTEIGFLPALFRSSLIAGLSMYEANKLGYFGNEWTDVHILSFRANDVSNLVSNKPIKTLEDLKGVKMRASGFVQQEIAKTLGMVGISLGPGEIYDSLQKGLIDANLLEWEGQYVWKAYEPTKYRVDKADLTIGAGTNYAMSLKTYNSLPADIRAVFDKYSGEWLVKLTSANMDRENLMRKEEIKAFDATRGNEWYDLPEAERARWAEALKPMIESYLASLEAKGLPSRAAYDKLKELSAKYEKMYPPGSATELAVWEEFGKDSVYPGYPPGEFWMPKK